MISLKRLYVAAVMSAVFLSAAGIFAASAQVPETDITPAHIERIRVNCTSAQNRLTQLHGTDALLRINRGQLYESMSARLMATMNGRIALNRLDGGNLVEIAAGYEQELANFRASYQAYEQHLADLLKLDCQKQPVTFYDGVAEVRSLRAAVHGHVVNLNRYIGDYQAAFEQFSQRLRESGRLSL